MNLTVLQFFLSIYLFIYLFFFLDIFILFREWGAGGSTSSFILFWKGGRPKGIGVECTVPTQYSGGVSSDTLGNSD